MVLPRIKKRYIYNGEIVYVWAQDLFFSVFLKNEPINNGSTCGASFFKENWFKFAFKAKNINI